MIKCKVCGREFTPVAYKHYISSRNNGKSGLVTSVKSTEGNIYDTFDCPACGCQIIAQERKKVYVTYIDSEDVEDNNDET